MADKTAKKERTFLTTGNDLLDICLGGGTGLGIETGDLVNIPGPSSSGKTLVAIEMIAANLYKYKDKFKWVYDDAESGCTFDTASMYGFELVPSEPKKIVKSKTIEEMSCNLRTFVRGFKPDEYGVYVVDSLDGLANKELMARAEARQKAHDKGKEFDEGSYMMATAAFLSKEFFRTLMAELHETNCVLIILSQLRSNVGGGLYAPKKIRAGGDALDFYCHSIPWLKVVEKLEVENRMVGATVELELKKSKTPRPGRKCLFTYYTSYGLDNIATSLDFLFDLRSATTGKLLDSKVDKIIWNDGMGPMNRDDMIQYILDNGLEEELRTRTFAKWEEIEERIKIKRPPKYRM